MTLPYVLTYLECVVGELRWLVAVYTVRCQQTCVLDEYEVHRNSLGISNTCLHIGRKRREERSGRTCRERLQSIADHIAGQRSGQPTGQAYAKHWGQFQLWMSLTCPQVWLEVPVACKVDDSDEVRISQVEPARCTCPAGTSSLWNQHSRPHYCNLSQ